MANGFPDLRDQTAALGGSAIPLPLLPQPIGLPVAPDDAPPVPLFGVGGLGEPIAAPEFLPAEQPLLGLDEFGAIAPPAVAAPPPVDIGDQAIAAPPAPEAGLQQLLDPFAGIAPPPEVAVPPAVAGFAPEVVPPGAPPALPPTALDLLQAPRPELAAATQRVGGLSDEQRRLRTQGQRVVIQLGQATTDEEREKLRTELGENQTATALNAQQLAVARQSSDEERVVARGQQADDLARFQAQHIQAARAEQQERAVLAEAAQARLDEQQASARTTHQETLKTHESIVAKSTGPGLGIAVGAMISEALAAFNQKRSPNFAAAMAVFQKQSAEAHRRQVESSRLKVNRTGDAVKDIARQKAEERAQDAASDEAHMRAAVNELDRVVATEQDRDRREAAAFVRDDLRRQADKRSAEAAAERAKQARAIASEDAKQALTLAKVGTERARAEELSAKAAKAGRRGRGLSRGAGRPGLIAANVVAVPGTDTPLVTFADDAKGRKEAQATRDIVGEQQSFLETMNSIEAFYEDAEGQGLISSIGVQGSDANQRLGVLIGVAKAKLAQIKAGPGKATTADDEKWAEGFVPENPKAWSNRSLGLKRLKSATSVFEDESRSILQRTTRLDTPTRERLVSEARKRGVSQTQRSRIEASRAAQTVLDAKADPEDRLTAVTLIEENARSKAGEKWLDVATEQTAALLDKIENPKVAAALTENLAKFQRLSRARVQQLKVALPFLADEAVRDADTGLPTGETRESSQLAKNPQVRLERATQARIRKAAKRRAKRELETLGGAAKESLSGLFGLTDEE